VLRLCQTSSLLYLCCIPRCSHQVLGRAAAGQLRLLYVAPEKLSARPVMECLRGLSPLPLVCVDEAHCMAEWGQGFRPAYFRCAHACGSSSSDYCKHCWREYRCTDCKVPGGVHTHTRECVDGVSVCYAALTWWRGASTVITACSSTQQLVYYSLLWDQLHTLLLAPFSTMLQCPRPYRGSADCPNVAMHMLLQAGPLAVQRAAAACCAGTDRHSHACHARLHPAAAGHSP
jgi:hypothetical protein